ncbi:MAG: 4'-phosphopantetheinyl transferase superfamily protein [Acidobacteria bacterium]|nr:4'-phosphopantetheinyl transferase superfamily protein [Acidobacteriota bacterium]
MPEHAARPEGLTSVPSPAILPAFAARHTVVMAAEAEMDERELPAELRQAVASRRRAYLAGRYCARRALAALLPGGAELQVGYGPHGAPIWPDGIVGSITHTGPLASAAVARATDARGLGIDSERLERFERSPGISRLVMLPEEAALGGSELSDSLRLPLVFSAKEAIFKCLYPLVGRRFWFEDAVLMSVALADGSFAARLTGELAAGIGTELRFHGRFAFDAECVHTAVWLDAPAQVG